MGSQDVTVDVLMQDICAALETAVLKERPEGEGWYTIAEIAESKGWSVERVRDNLGRLVKQGRMETEKVGVKSFYRLK